MLVEPCLNIYRGKIVSTEPHAKDYVGKSRHVQRKARCLLGATSERGGEAPLFDLFLGTLAVP